MSRPSVSVSQAPAQQKPGMTQSGLLQRKCACGNHTLAGGGCTACSKRKPMGLQAKLEINEPGDSHEQEADRIADQVLASPANRAISGTSPRIQRYSAQSAGQGEAASPSVDQALAGHGSPLEPALRQDMEQRFGHDFSRVRVHTGATAEHSTREVNALAYTAGHHIVVGARRFAPGTPEGRHLLAHELTHVVQQSGAGRFPGSVVQRKCLNALGPPKPDCLKSQQGVGGWQFMFKQGCDELLPGEEAKLGKLKPGRKLNIHGFASREGEAGFNEDLSCHRANVIAGLAQAQRPDCPVVGRFKHGASPAASGAGTGATKDANPPDFWRNVIIEEVRPTPEEWLDPSSIIAQGWQLYARAQNAPIKANLDAIATRRGQLKTWLESIPKSVAPAGAQLDRKDLTDYRQFYTSAEALWKAIDKLLAGQGYAAAGADTYDKWAAGTGGVDSGSESHAKHVPAGAKYHIDLFGEGYFPGAVNIGMAERSSTTGVWGTRVPNLIYRKFSASNAAVNRLPIADHVADVVTSENGPLMDAGLIDEIARIIAPGGTIILYGPDNMERFHDQMAKVAGGTIKKEFKNGGLESIITVPGP